MLHFHIMHLFAGGPTTRVVIIFFKSVVEKLFSTEFWDPKGKTGPVWSDR